MTEPKTKFSQRTNFLGEELEDAVRRARLLDLASKATEALNHEGLSEIGALSVAAARHDDDWSYFAHLRSEPSGAHGGAEFRFPLQRSNPAHDQDIIRSVISSARRFVENQEVIAAKTRNARTVAEDLVGSAIAFDWPAKLVSIGCEYGFENVIVFDVEILEYDLQMSRTRVVSRHSDNVGQELSLILDEHEFRTTVRYEMRKKDISFLVDGAAKSVLEAVGLDTSDTVRALGCKRHLEFKVVGTDGNNYDGAVFFKDGVLLADFMSDGNPVRFQTDELTLFDTKLPETLIASLPGRNLGDLIDLPWLPADALITDVQGNSELLYVKLRCPRFGMTKDGLRLCEGPLQASPLL